MPIAITIPISTFEATYYYEKLQIRLLADRARAVQELFDAFAPWNPNVDDMEVLTTGKNSEQGIRIKVTSQGFSFFFGPTSCKFTKESAVWADADRIQKYLETSLDALHVATGLSYGNRTATLSAHLQSVTVPVRDILRRFVTPDLQTLDSDAPTAMAFIARWPQRVLTLDGSMLLANALFVRTERDFDARTTFADIKNALLRDQVELYKLLDVQEIVS